MAFDNTNTAPRLTAWTTYEELTADQRERFGDYVLAKDEARADGIYRQERAERARAALAKTGDDKLAALALMLGGL